MTHRIVALVALAAALALPEVASAQITLPFTEGFEGTSGETYGTLTTGLTGAPEWDYSNTDAAGRLRMAAGTGFYNTGGAAATMDRDPSGAVQINYLTLNLDMSNYTTADLVVLDFALMSSGEEASANDRVWVRGSNTDAYVELGNLNTLDGASGSFVSVTGLDVTAALTGAAQNFSSTFQVRFGQEDNFPANTPSGSDGYTFDDIELRLIPNAEVGATAILSPAPGACGLSTSMIEVQIENFGNVQSNIPVEVSVSGDVTALLTGTVAGPVPFQGTDSVLVGPVDLFSATSITIAAETQLAGDADASNDAITPVTLAVTPTEIITDTPATTCPGSPASLAVTTPVAGEVYDWLDAPGGTVLGSGDTFTTPAGTGPSFWVQRSALVESAGPVDNSFGGGGNYNFLSDGLEFDVTEAVTLDTVVVYPNGAGDVVVRLLDSADNVLETATVAVAGSGATVIPLGFDLPIGTGFQLDALGTTTGGMFRNNNSAVYPYSSGGGEVSITGPINALSGYYYFFYNWQISAGGCGGEASEVVVPTDASLCAADLAVTVTGPDPAPVAGAEATWTLTVENLGPDTATGISLDDPTPAGLTFVSATGDCTLGFPCSLSDMLPGAVTSIDVVFLVPADWDPAVPLVNAATVSATEPDAEPGNDAGDSTSTVVQEADLSITVVDDPDPVQAGGVVAYTITIANAGPSDAADVVVASTFPEGFGDVVVTTGCTEDPDGTPTCSAGAVAADGTLEVLIELGIDPATPAGSIDATFEVSSSAGETTPGDESVTETTAIEVSADLTVTIADDVDPVQPGDPITYTVEVTNNGPSNAAGVRAEITIGDGGSLTEVPDGCTDEGGLVCTWESLDAEATATVEVETTAPDAEGTHTTSVTVSHDTAEAAEGDEDASEETLVARVADLVLTAALDPETVSIGGQTTLTASIANGGPSDVDDAVATITLPDGVALGEGAPCTGDAPEVTCEIGEVGSGASVDLEVLLTVDAEAGIVTIEVSVTASPADPTEDDNTVVLELTIEAGGDDDDDDDAGGGGGDRSGVVGCDCGSSLIAADGAGPSAAWLLLGVLALRRRRG